MISTTTDIVIAVLMFVGFILFALAMWGIALRVGPRRGFWNQPAAVLRRPGRGVFVAMYVLAAIHVLLGVAVAIGASGDGRVGVLVVMVAMGAFYVACAHCYALATAATRRRARD